MRAHSPRKTSHVLDEAAGSAKLLGSASSGPQTPRAECPSAKQKGYT
jgi:hypothetical protein